MEFLKLLRRRSVLSELVYVGLNVGLAVAVLIIVRTVESPIPAFILVALSKWRVFAVRPRYWLANIQANFVDFIVSMSVVILMYSVGVSGSYALVLQICIVALYIAWLVYLKPRSSKRSVVSQAWTALIIGTTALFVASYSWPVELVVLGMAVIGYVAGRHALTQFEEDHLQFLSLMCALVMAHIGWIFYHWVIAYSLPVVEARIPQVTVIVAVIFFALYKVYDSYKRNDKVEPAEVVMPVLFSVGIVLTLMIFFSAIPIGTL